jgi:exonuclease SbcD
MPSVRFIHTADLHLDSPFKGLSRWNADLAERLKDASFKSFRIIADLCITEKVDFLIIAGDIFDSENKSLAAQLKFVAELKRLSENGISSYFVCGNHDPLKSWMEVIRLPENVYRFDSSEVQVCTFMKDEEPVAQIHGISFADKSVKANLAVRYKLAPGKAPVSIAVLHGTVGMPGPHESYAPFTTSEIAGKGFDYWALGHIHKNQIVSPSNPAIVYPGNPQGRDFGETGEKGCMLVEITSGNDPVTRFIPTGIIRFEDLEVDMTGTDNIDLLLGMITEKLEASENYDPGSNYIIRITLRGRTPLHHALNNEVEAEALTSHFNEELASGTKFILIDRINVNTRPDIDTENIRNGTGFIAELLNNLHSYRENNPALEILIKEIEVDFINASVKKEIGDLSEDDMKSLLENAQSILTDKLLKEE